MEGTLAEIRMFAGNFAPRGWLFCQGQLLSIAQWTAVFALVGTTYGGNGQTTFGVPDFRGRIGLGTGSGPGLPNVDLGEMAGTRTTTLILTNLPFHNHAITGTVNVQVNNDTAGLTDDATNKRLAATGAIFTAAAGDLVSMAPCASTLATGFAGSNQPFSTMPPYLGMNFIFCVEGIFPSRN
ncbi:MAG: phage tail protein [Chitinophagaceae bacterium]|nr:phage tail protein [Chitinophagaceae bacterium]MBL0337126.1 phage tail protein [Chitinophagaceae bacterium]